MDRLNAVFARVAHITNINHPSALGKRGLRATLALVVGLVAASSLRGQEIAPSPPQSISWALLIGVEKYRRATPLRYTVNDVKQLAATLRDRGGYPRGRMLELTDESTEESRRPLKEHILAELPRFLARPGPADRLVVYFTGHGFHDASGKLYLAPLDCDPANPAATGIPVEWFRNQLAACKAGFKLLILDACHAGSEKGDDDASAVAAKDLAEPFRGLEGVVTLASSTAKEKSQIWDDKQQSLFSYWLVQGLKGHADSDGDGAVDIDELNKYVYRRVTHTAEVRFGRSQTPVRIVRTGTPGAPEVVRLRPQGLPTVLADLAEQLALALEEKRLGKVGVLEFTSESAAGELLGAEFGLLGRWCADELERRLIDLGEGKFTVADRQRLLAALAAQRFEVRDLGSPQALQRLSESTGGMPVLAKGTLRGRAGRMVNLQCKLIQTGSDDIAGSAGGLAQLTESDWAMLGHSAALNPGDRMPPPPDPDRPLRPVADQVVARLDDRSRDPHPLLKSGFPFPVRVKIGGKERAGIARGNDWLIPVRAGETYEITVENLSGRPVCMRLLVDGLNTLPELESAKGVSTMIWGKRVRLDAARHYVLDPAFSQLYSIRGFRTADGAQGKIRPFVVVPGQQSVAARRRFTDQIGLITAAFYNPANRSRQVLGTGAGDERHESSAIAPDLAVGSLIAVVNIRYVDADELGIKVP